MDLKNIDKSEPVTEEMIEIFSYPKKLPKIKAYARQVRKCETVGQLRKFISSFPKGTITGLFEKDLFDTNDLRKYIDRAIDLEYFKYAAYLVSCLFIKLDRTRKSILANNACEEQFPKLADVKKLLGPTVYEWFINNETKYTCIYDIMRPIISIEEDANYYNSAQEASMPEYDDGGVEIDELWDYILEICNGDDDKYQYLRKWIAHLVTYQRPRTTLVFEGEHFPKELFDFIGTVMDHECLYVDLESKNLRMKHFGKESFLIICNVKPTPALCKAIDLWTSYDHAETKTEYYFLNASYIVKTEDATLFRETKKDDRLISDKICFIKPNDSVEPPEWLDDQDVIGTFYTECIAISEEELGDIPS